MLASIVFDVSRFASSSKQELRLERIRGVIIEYDYWESLFGKLVCQKLPVSCEPFIDLSIKMGTLSQETDFCDSSNASSD